MSETNGSRPPGRPFFPRHHGRLAALVIAGLLALGVLYAALVHTSPTGLHVENNQLVENGEAMRLLGVGLSGTQTRCRDALGLRKAGLVPSVAALRSWKADTVLVPISADCWLGSEGAGGSAGVRYQDAIQALVDLLGREGFAVVLSLDRISPSGPRPPMPGQEAVDLWSQVALTFKARDRLLFDLWAHPHGVGWDCWVNGCSRGGEKLVGMQVLVDVVRHANARQPVIIPGLEDGADLSGWLAHPPVDAAGGLVAGFRRASGAPCADRACWDEQLGAVAKAVPVLTVELSESDCAHGLLDEYMGWADEKGISYLGWAWQLGACSAPSLIRNRAGAPTAFGIGLRDHLRALAG